MEDDPAHVTHPAPGRPRSLRARDAVLEAADDLLREQGYAAMTMKGIAQRAGVGRQTVYRWWSSKAEVLAEACHADALEELTLPPQADAHAEVSAYLAALIAFLTRSDAGLAYRALLGEAQHDREVRALLAATDVLGPTARAVLERLGGHGVPLPGGGIDRAVPELVGPVLYRALTALDENLDIDPSVQADALLCLFAALPG